MGSYVDNDKPTPTPPKNADSNGSVEDTGSGVRKKIPPVDDIVAGSALTTSLEFLLNTARVEKPTRRRRLVDAGPDGSVGFVETIARARAWLEKADPAISGKGGHKTAFRVIERVVRGFELNEQEALDALYVWNQRCEPPWSETELRHKIKDALEHGDTPLGELRDEKPKTQENGFSSNGTASAPGVTFVDPRSVITITTELHYNVDQSVEALKSDPNLYQRDGALVHVTRVTHEQSEKSPKTAADDGTLRPALVEGSPQIVEMAIATLRERLTRYARFRKWNERNQDYKFCLPTDHIVSATHARRQWPVRELVGTTESPMIRPDGDVMQDPGYDHQTGYLYQPSETFPRVPDSPTQNDAVRALKELYDVFVDFPYVNDAHRAVPVAAILTLIARPAIQGATPAFIFDASTRGSGKTLQTDAIAMVVSGRTMPRMSFPSQEEELEKVLGAYALRGSPFFSLDNVTRPFGGGSLDRVITARDTVELRVLGMSKIPTLSWRAVIFATGNNLSIYADTARRVLMSRLEPTDEHPERRTQFAHDDLPAWTRRERARLVTAALTLLRAYYVAGRPPQECARWGSFEEWSRLIPQAIVWAGGADPMKARPELDSEVDAEVAAMSFILSEIYRMHPDEQMKASTIIQSLFQSHREVDAKGNLVPDSLDPLRETVTDLCEPKPGRSPDAKTLGKYFARHRGRVIGSLRLNGKTGKGGILHWWVSKAPAT